MSDPSRIRKIAGCTAALLIPLTANLAAAGPEPTDAPAPGTALNLRGSISQALSRNFTVRTAAYGPTIAEAGVREAAGAFDPVGYLELSTGRDESQQTIDPFSDAPDSFVSETEAATLGVTGRLPTGTRYDLSLGTFNRRGTFNAFEDRFNSSVGIELTQPLLDGFGPAQNLAAIRVARGGRERSDWQFRQTVMDIVTATVDAYYTLYFARQSLETALRNRDLAASLLQENRRRVELGTMAEVDALVAESQLALREERVLISRRLVREAENSFKGLVFGGEPDLLDRRITVTRLPEPVRIEPDVEAAFRTAQEQLPEYRAARVDRRIREILLVRDRRARLPSLDLVGGFGYSALDADFGQSLDDLGRQAFENWRVGAVFRMPVPNREARARADAARLALMREDEQIAALEQAMRLTIDDAAFRLRMNWQRIEAARLARELAERSLEAEARKLELGTTTSFVVLRLQGDLADAEVREVQAITDYHRAVAAYQRETGTILDAFQVELPDPVDPRD